MIMTTRFALASSLLAVLVVPAAAQVRVPGDDDMHLNCNVGSFRMQGSDKVPSHGHLQITFSGTLLVVGLKGNLAISGDVHKEYEDSEIGRQVYFGKGSAVLDGQFTAIQWFGREMSAEFKGVTIVNLYGEFDKDLNTGTYWFAADPKQVVPWYTGGRQLTVPLVGKFRLTPTVRKEGS